MSTFPPRFLDSPPTASHWLLREPGTVVGHPPNKNKRPLTAVVPPGSPPSPSPSPSPTWLMPAARRSFRRSLFFLLSAFVICLCVVVYPSLIKPHLSKVFRFTSSSSYAYHNIVCNHSQVPTTIRDGEYFAFADGAKYDNVYLPIHIDANKNNGPMFTQFPSLEPLAVPLTCLDDLVAHGRPCTPSTPESTRKLDVVWTYVNGTDGLHEAAYRYNLKHEQTLHPKAYFPPANAKAFRQYDELRHSVRSVLQNFRSSARELFVVTSDFPYPGCDDGREWRLGQIPAWLVNRDDLAAGSVPRTWRDGETPLSVVHHSNIFGPLQNKSIFNSLAIESRLGHIEGVSEHFVYMNDDVFLNTEMSTYDFYTEGPIFRMQSDLLVGGYGTMHGEWVALQHSNQFLDGRFGVRKRPYLAHIAKTLSKSFLREIWAIWGEELATTSSHPFRSLTHIDPDSSTTFLVTHYVVERWREILLWSFFVASVGGDNDEWTAEHTTRAWSLLGGAPGENVTEVERGVRSTLENLKSTLFDAPDAPKNGSTELVYSSFDGYPYAWLRKAGFRRFPNFTHPVPELPTRSHPALTCRIDLQQCLYPPSNLTLSATEVFKHVAFRVPECGDCIIDALVNRTGTQGLSAFLPSPTRSPPRKSRLFAQTESITRLPLSKQWEWTDFTLANVQFGNLTVRQWVVQAIYRYRFMIGLSFSNLFLFPQLVAETIRPAGNTPSAFYQLETVSSTTRVLGMLKALEKSNSNKPSIICVNDDVTLRPNMVGDLFKDWMGSKWGTKAQWETD
ncbi:hypothetical protein FRB99_001885 [Tulasnella sp. 403]|nr:hypothetical protein FRB99_001885 [Tulasnella sp. 403]